MNRTLASWALPLVLGCGSPQPDPDGSVVLDLAARLDDAEVLRETRLIDIGTADARSFLGSGWSWNETDSSEVTFAWSAPYNSEVVFFLAEPRAVRLLFRCKPFRREARVVESLSIGVNGNSHGELPLRKGWQEYGLDLPAGSLRRGINRLSFGYHWRHEGVDSKTKRGRRVGVAWDWIRFPGIDTGRPPVVTSPGVVTLAADSQVDFYLAATGDTVLVVDEVRRTGSRTGGLAISIQREGDDAPTTTSLGDLSPQEAQDISSKGGYTAGFGQQIRIPVTTGAGLARLRFRASGDFELSRPRVLAAAGSEEASIETSARPTSTAVPRSRPPLILLYLIDTLRADHLTPYGYGRDTSPGLARLTEDAVIFEDAMAHSSWTKPSTASILTGHLPWSHGAETKKEALSGEIRSLAHFLQDAGFKTGAFSANGNISRLFGFHHGFDHFSLMGQFNPPANEVQDQALRWLADHDVNRGAFVYIHTIDPHAPYSPTGRQFSEVPAASGGDRVGSVPFMRRLARSRQDIEPGIVEALVDLYDGEIAFSDRQFAEMIDTLESLDLYESSLILVVSDHGEEFYDHGSWTHGRTLHREVLRVPLMIKFPGNWGARARIADTAQQIDLLPTVLDYLALPRPADLPGSSLLCSVQQALSEEPLNCETGRARPVFSSVHYHNNHWLGVILGDWKLLLQGAGRLDPETRLFNRRLDPGESENVAALHPIRVGYLTSLIRTEKRSRPVDGAAQSVELDEETRERLEALGYLD